MKKSWDKDDLVSLKKQHEVLIAIDSDGCVFDSMTMKQRIFHSGLIEFWELETVEQDVRKIAEWVSLYSPWRGLNRFQLILRIFEELNDRGIADIPLGSLAAFVESGVPLSAAELSKRIEQTDDEQLKTVLAWSLEMNHRIAAIPDMPVFEEVRSGLEALRGAADLIVVSQTTEEALVREWDQADLTLFVEVIAGAELGSKTECLQAAMTGRYGATQTLMVGDAPGDLEAARAAGCLFFPILPGAENESWIELQGEGLDRIQSSSFAGTYQEDLISRFNAVLSATFPG